MSVETGLCGWGARTRTWEWRNQNPLPYHLATPQRPSRDRAQDIAAAVAAINVVHADWSSGPRFRVSAPMMSEWRGIA
jgi:hypothetical protein